MDELFPLVKQLYKNQAEEVCKELSLYRRQFPKNTNQMPNLNWYKYLNLYFIYPESITGTNGTPLTRLATHLPHIKDLGCDAIHILPFLDSPLVDKGFDVSNFFHVRKELGTLQDIKQLVKEARLVGLRVFMDLVFNHVSDQHEWYKKAVSGDEKYREYFIYQKTKPNFIKKFHKDSAVWAQYQNGKKKVVNIAFPEYTGEIPHWREGTDGYWYYHTYYPEQLDVNWKNPDVFLEFAKIVMYWGSLGFNFRLDAIPFVGKSAYKDVDNNNDFTRTLLMSFTKLAENINPEAVFIMETYEKPHTVIDYFGTTNTKQVKLGYNFHLCTYLWVALIKKDASYIWKKLKQLDNIPIHAEWINFLRNHDELSLAYLEEDLLKDVKRELLKYGAPFREGYGVSGRTYSLLGNDEQRFLSAYFLLSSLPGGMLLPYGDEFGKVNIPFDELTKHEQTDTRSINRGILTKKEMKTPKGKRISSKIKEFLCNRRYLQEYINSWPTKLPSPKGVFAAYYEKGSSRLVILINLTSQNKKVSLDTTTYTILQKLFDVRVTEKEITLSPNAGIWLQK